MDVKEVAEYLGFSTTKVYRMLTAREIPNVKVGGQYRFPKAVIDDWLTGKLFVPESSRAAKNKRTSKLAPGKKVTADRPAGNTRPEDQIVGHLLAHKTNGATSERRRAKQVMVLSMDDLDWQYLAKQAETAGVLDDAIVVEKEINNLR